MKKRLLFAILLLLMLTPLTTTSINAAANAKSALLAGGWSRIEPGGETVCAHGTPYAYWVRPGTRNDLLVYMEGGGGCWNADTCRATGEEFNGYYDSAVTENDNPIYRDGVLDLDNAENPFADYTMVYIPVCTGDVHWGNSVTIFGDVTVNFKGFVNAAAALDWAYENVPQPDSVFVTGCSAGSAGSIVHTPYIIEHYPDTPVYQFGDSLTLLNEGPVDFQAIWKAHDNFPQWIPALVEMEPLEWTMARFYTAVANYYPEYTFSQFNTMRDRVQVFYSLGENGDPATWTALLETHLGELQENAPNYRSFTAGGDLHCVTPRQSFYTYAIDGIRLRDWVADMARGYEVDSLHCTDCERAEIVRQ